MVDLIFQAHEIFGLNGQRSQKLDFVCWYYFLLYVERGALDIQLVITSMAVVFLISMSGEMLLGEV